MANYSEPSFGLSLNDARDVYNSTFRTVVTNFYGPMAPTRSNFIEESTIFDEIPNGFFYKPRNEAKLYIYDSDNTKRRDGNGFTRTGFFRTEDSLEALQANVANYEIGELVSTVSDDSQLAPLAKLYIIRDNAAQNSSIMSVGQSVIRDRTVVAFNLANSAVTTRTIADNAVDGDKLSDDAVTRDKLADSSVNTDQIDDAAVTSDKLNDISPNKFSGNFAGSKFTNLGSKAINAPSSGGYNLLLSATGGNTLKWNTLGGEDNKLRDRAVSSGVFISTPNDDLPYGDYLNTLVLPDNTTLVKVVTNQDMVGAVINAIGSNYKYVIDKIDGTETFKNTDSVDDSKLFSTALDDGTASVFWTFQRVANNVVLSGTIFGENGGLYKIAGTIRISGAWTTIDLLSYGAMDHNRVGIYI